MKEKPIALRPRHELQSIRQSSREGLVDPVPSDSPLHTAQLIGALVIRFVMYAQSGQTWDTFPDKGLIESILEHAKDRSLTERHLVALLFHHSKILDNCGTPEKKENLRKLTSAAFPRVNQHKVMQLVENTQDAQWEIV